jgi:hypothetical protein
VNNLKLRVILRMPCYSDLSCIHFPFLPAGGWRTSGVDGQIHAARCKRGALLPWPEPSQRANMVLYSTCASYVLIQIEPVMSWIIDVNSMYTSCTSVWIYGPARTYGWVRVTNPGQPTGSNSNISVPTAGRPVGSITLSFSPISSGLT